MNKNKILTLMLISFSSITTAKELKVEISEYTYGKTGEDVYIQTKTNVGDFRNKGSEITWRHEIVDAQGSVLRYLKDAKQSDYTPNAGFEFKIEKEGKYRIRSTVSISGKKASDTTTLIVKNKIEEKNGEGKLEKLSSYNDADNDMIVDGLDMYPNKKAEEPSYMSVSFNFFNIDASSIVVKGETFNITGKGYSPNINENVIILKTDNEVYNVTPIASTPTKLLAKYPTNKDTEVGVAVGNEINWYHKKIKGKSPEDAFLEDSIFHLTAFPNQAFLVKGRNLNPNNVTIYFKEKELKPLGFKEEGVELMIPSNMADSGKMRFEFLNGESNELELKLLKKVKVKFTEGFLNVLDKKGIDRETLSLGGGLFSMKNVGSDNTIEEELLADEVQELNIIAGDDEAGILTSVMIAPGEKNYVVDENVFGVSLVEENVDLSNVFRKENYKKAKKMLANIPSVQSINDYIVNNKLSSVFEDTKLLKKLKNAIKEYKEEMIINVNSGELKVYNKINFEGYLRSLDKSIKGIDYLLGQVQISG